VGTALELALTQAARRAKLDALVMVDGRGMLVAKNRTELDVTMLAAVTPIVGQGRAVPRIRRQGRERGMSVRVFELDGEAFYMAAVGGEFIARQRELLSGATAAKRILA
jgi:hypothetical protein